MGIGCCLQQYYKTRGTASARKHFLDDSRGKQQRQGREVNRRVSRQMEPFIDPATSREGGYVYSSLRGGRSYELILIVLVFAIGSVEICF